MTPLQPTELERQRAFLRRLARELVRCPAAAEDVVQDAFVLALERPPVEPGALRGWLARVVRNLASNRARAQSRRGARERAAARPEATPPHDEALASLELQERVLALVKALPEPYRTTLWLRYHEGLAPAAIAERERTTPKTVESRLTRGLALLRAELDRASDGERRAWLAGLARLAAEPSRAPAPILTSILGASAMKKVLGSCLLLVLLGVAWRLRGGEAPRAAPGEPPAALGMTPSAASPSDRREALPVAVEEPPSAASGGTLLVHVRWADGTSAPGVGLFLFPEGDPQGERRVVDATSDADGRARVEGLHPGAVRVEADRGAVVRASVGAGRESEVVLELDVGMDVIGTVRDAAGLPVAGAEVVLVSSRRDWLATRVVTRTAEDGSYRVRAAGGDCAVSARAPGFVPAFLHELVLGDPSEPVRADFVLDWVGFAVRGRVVDPRGEPVSGARVAAGQLRGRGYWDEEGKRGQRFGMPVVTTDEGGAFEAHGIEHAELPLSVMAEGYPIQVAERPGWVGSLSFAEIALAEPATLAGRVLGPTGEPLAGARLEVEGVGGRAAKDIPFPLPHATSDGDGRFRLELLAPGRVPIRVRPPEASALPPGFLEPELAPGEVAELDVQLREKNVIRGRALDAGGGPAELDVFLRHEGRSEPVAVDGHGAFAVEGCDDPPYALELRAEEAPGAIVELEPVWPGPDEVLLVAPALGSVKGIFLDEAGLESLVAKDVPASADPLGRMPMRPAQGPIVFLEERDGGFSGRVQWSGDEYRFDAVPPGRYRVTIKAYSDGPSGPNMTWLHASDWFQLDAGEHVDLGVARTPRPGWLELELLPADAPGLSCVVRTTEFTVASLVREPRVELVPGTYWVTARADGMADACAPVVIRSDEETRASLRLEPGVARTLEFRLGEGSEPWREVRVAVRAADGSLVVARALDARVEPLGLLVHLPAGEFTLEAESDAGLRAAGAFRVEALGAQERPLVFELR